MIRSRVWHGVNSLHQATTAVFKRHKPCAQLPAPEPFSPIAPVHKAALGSRRYAYWIGAALFAPLPLAAADFKLGDVDASVSGQIAGGIAIRSNSADPGLINSANAAAVGLVGRTSASNSDDSNLNYKSGDPVSTVIKGFIDFSLKRDTMGALVRVKAWHDFTMDDHNVPWGNTPNGLQADQPLSDHGFRKRSKFSGVALQDAYGYNTFLFADRPLYVKAGNQTIVWGDRVTFGGGLSAIRPFDAPAALRPGVAPEEIWVPVPAVLGRLSVTDKLNVEAYYQIRFRPGETPGCGTFFGITDYLAEGCNAVTSGGAVPGVRVPNDRQRLAAGAFVKRSATPGPSNSGLYGIGTTYKIDALNTVVGVYHARYNNPFFLLPNTVKSLRTVGAPFITGDPDGKNPTYFTEYAEGIRLYAMNFETKLQQWTAYGEASYRPNMPVAFNGGDTVAAGVSNAAPTPLRADISALPPGGILLGYQRLKTGQVQLGASRQFRGVLGGANLSLGAEVVVKHVFDLPDFDVHRFGRADTFGAGPIKGVCSGGSFDLDKQCTKQGYVTRYAEAYSVNVTVNYGNLFPDLTVAPRLVFTHDVKGWSYDGLLNEGRQSLALAIPMVYRKAYSATIAYTSYWGGRYSLNKDRDYLALSIGARF